MNDKFDIDDILAEFDDDKKKSVNNEKNGKETNATPATSGKNPGATMILRSIDEKKKAEAANRTSQKSADTKEIPKQSIKHMKADIGDKYKPHNTEIKPESQTSVKNGQTDKSKIAYKRLSDFEEEKTAQPKAKQAADSSSNHTVNTHSKARPNKNTSKHSASKADSEPDKITAHTGGNKKAKNNNRKKDKINVSINTSANMSFIDKIKQYRFLFEELTKRDFKKKYKRTLLGVLWSVISPFVTFLVQYFVFSYIFRRHDTQFVIYLLSGTLMFNFFTNATTAGMFSMYSNGGILSKVNVPKSLFVLSSNSAAIFNFMLTLVIYFGFMVFCHVSFGIHLLMMIFPILCLIIFNIGMSYILSSLFVFFRDMQYLYQIFTMLLMYMSAIFYEIDRFPENLRFVFDINPIYHFVTYIRQLVIYATVPDFTSHIICLAFAFGMLAIGYFVHRKTEQKFVYYY